MKSQEQLNEQAEVAQILSDGMARGDRSGFSTTAHLADLILKSDWLQDRILRDVEKLTGRRFAYLTLDGKRIGVPGEIVGAFDPDAATNPKDAA